jgi:pre-mRNA-processing factor 17
MQKEQDDRVYIPDDCKELTFNPKYEELWTPKLGPENPNITDFHKAAKNTLSGYVEAANMSEFQFENQRQTFNNYGYAIDPTSTASGDRIIGNAAEAIQNNSIKTNFLN